MSVELTLPLIEQVEATNTLGEGIIWDPRQGAFLWTDIQESRLFKWEIQTQAIQAWDLPSRAGSFGLTDDVNILVVAFEEGIGLLSMLDGEVDWLLCPDTTEDPDVRFNDGRVDPAGRFCAGTMNEADENSPNPVGALYQVDGHGKHQTLIENVGVSNGLCWSPDGQTMFFADSPKQTIFQYRYQPVSGRIEEKRVFATTSGDVFPDGGICDANGHYWSAQWGGSQIVQYDATGTVIATLKVPVSQPTCLCIGGPNMDLLAVTSARAGLDDSKLADTPQAGNVFLYQLPSSIGVAEHQFILSPSS